LRMQEVPDITRQRPDVENKRLCVRGCQDLKPTF